MKVLIIGAMLIIVGVVAAPAFAGSGIAKVDTFLDKISTALKGAGVVVCAIALMWAGYQFFFRHADMMYCARIVGGGLLIGGATEIAGYILG